MSDSTLPGISCIIIDEAHERSLNTNLDLSLLKKLLFNKPNLRLVVMSATVDADKFSKYFHDCSTLHVSGRNFLVEIHCLPPETKGTLRNSSQKTFADFGYVQNTIDIVNWIHKIEGVGAILAFLTPQAEVEWAYHHFEGPNAKLLRLHGKLSSKELGLDFRNYLGRRKIVFGTNIAETSLTIPDMRDVK